MRWCPRQDLNPHARRHGGLSSACLPFHHLGNVENWSGRWDLNPRPPSSKLGTLTRLSYPQTRLAWGSREEAVCGSGPEDLNPVLMLTRQLLHRQSLPGVSGRRGCGVLGHARRIRAITFRNQAASSARGQRESHLAMGEK